MRTPRLIAAVVPALVASAVAAAPVWAADVTVDATPGNLFTPRSAAVRPGETVTFVNAGGFHNVVFDDGSFTRPTSASTDPWREPRRFLTAGRFAYHCGIHGASGGSGMSGVVFVNASGLVPPPDAPPAISRPSAAGGRRSVKVTLVSSAAGTASGSLLRRPPGARRFLTFGSVRFAVRRGSTSVTLRRTVTGRTLTPGTYVVTITVAGRARNRSRPVQLRFSVR
jgi:plastocyanin